ncbi:MAG: transposase family protein [Bacteroidota bacterium]
MIYFLRPSAISICEYLRELFFLNFLTHAQKQENGKISSFRIPVEHAIGGIKKCRIVKERFRCRKFGFDDLVMLIACGLHNFRITMSLNLRPV